jgi:hypothetical protein
LIGPHYTGLGDHKDFHGYWQQCIGVYKSGYKAP